ncbi:MAG: BON domain-containing protein [Desulfovibrionaceae bacterium]
MSTSPARFCLGFAALLLVFAAVAAACERQEPARLSDMELARKIEHGLFINPFVDSDDIQVSVVNRRAILRGEALTWVEEHLARLTALNNGAEEVVSEINIRYGPSFYGNAP